MTATTTRPQTITLAETDAMTITYRGQTFSIIVDTICDLDLCPTGEHIVTTVTDQGELRFGPRRATMRTSGDYEELFAESVYHIIDLVNNAPFEEL